jgi:hypothetical protein
MKNDEGMTTAMEPMLSKSRDHGHEPALYGHCTQCSCPGFQGSGYTCTRGGCDHHYDEHSS